MQIRATICAFVDNPGEVEDAEEWIEKNQGSLTYISDMGGCGCCVVDWDIEGPEEIIATLPNHLSAGSSWASGGNT